MSYRVTSVTGSPSEKRAIAAFLADFVRDGGLLRPRPGDDDPKMWERRMGWWWDENPHCRDDSPKGFVLAHRGDGIVGFTGFIPYAYESDGIPVPTLVSTTFFVREGHRDAVMGLIARHRTLGRDYQIIDSSPSPEMRRLLGKLGYRQAGDRAQYFFPTRRLGGAVARTLVRGLGWSHTLPGPETAADCHIVTDPADWPAPEVPPDGRVHPRLDRMTLCWLARVGSEPRSFFGLLDAGGAPLACAFGVYKKRLGLRTCLLLGYRDLAPGRDSLGRLLRRLLDDPRGSGLDPATGLLVLSRFGGESHHGVPGRRTASIFHYHLPPPWQTREKACLPVEGDLVLL